METINIKFDKKQLDDIVKRVTENIIKESKKELTYNESKLKYSLMYLEANETHYESKKVKIYFGYAHNTLSKDYASEFDLTEEVDSKKVNELKEHGWEEEIFYK